jgi:hypothetical protein
MKGVVFSLRSVQKRRAVGKRARRQAFYARRREDRWINGMLRVLVSPMVLCSDDYLDALIYGEAWVEKIDGSGCDYRWVAPFDVLLQAN